MTQQEFETAWTDIEKPLEGDGYMVDFHMKSGQVWRKASWRYASDGDQSLVALEIAGSGTPIYLPISEIEGIHLCQ